MNARLSLLVLLSLGGASVIGCSDDATTTDSATDVVTVDVAPDTAPDVIADANPGNDAVADAARDVPATDVPATDVPATDVPATDVPAADVPATDVPATDVPATDVPATDVPATDVPATDVPASDGGVAASCVASGGTIGSGLCCASASDFPNSCLTGACGCSPTASHTVMTCVCPSGTCFNGTRCAAP